MRIEVEARFLATGPDVLLALSLIPRLGPATLGEPATSDETDRYLDTADRRLAAALWACRLRSRGTDTWVSLKGPPRGSASWLHRRPELEGPATASTDPDEWPASEAHAFLDQLRGGEPLEERIRLLQRRTERPVRPDGADEPFGTLTLDQVAISAGSRPLGRLHVVELEARPDAAEVEPQLTALAEALAGVPGLEPEPRTKLEHALELLAVPVE